VKIQVTQEDIDNGLAGSCRLCPVAKAIGRHTGLPVRVSGFGYAVIDGNDIFLPIEVETFISYFDHPFERTTCKPFEFDLAI
jgi:hypothetical protein